MTSASDAAAREGRAAGPGPRWRGGRWHGRRRPAERPTAEQAGVDPPSGDRAPVRLACGVLVLVLAGGAVPAAAALAAGVLAPAATVPARALGSTAVLAQLAVQLWYSLRGPGPAPCRTTAVVVLLQAGLAALTAAAVGTAWPGLGGFAVGSLLLGTRHRVALPASAALVALVLLLDTLRGDPSDPRQMLLVVVVSGVLGLVVAGATRLVQVMTGLLEARAEAARERARLARDVHDLLGLGLSAITLKCDLALRLLPAEAALSRVQLTEVMTLARRALADVRSVAQGGESLSLDEEVTLARDLLMTVDVRVRVRVDRPAPTGPAGAVLAAALREGVTNVLRHSDASHCAIAVLHAPEGVSLEIVNDGVRPVSAAQPPGQGLRNLRERAAGLGGAVFDGRRGRTHVLRVVLPRPGGPSPARRLTASPPRARSGSRPHGSARRAWSPRR